MTEMRRDTRPEAVPPVSARPARRRRAPAGTSAEDPPLPDPARVDPDVLLTLLARHGWCRKSRSEGRYSRWTPPDDREPDTSVLVPADRSFEDSADLLEEALGALSRSAVPSAQAILAALLVPGDEIHWRRDTPGVGGAVPWAAEQDLRAAAPAMLVAAAKTLVRALEAMRDAVDYQRATGRPDAFDDGVLLGVSRELVASVVRLVRGSEGVRITLSWSPAVGAPQGFGDRRLLLEFSPGDLPALEAAVQRLERSEPALEVEVTGAVVRLKRQLPGGSGAVRLRVLSGAEVDEVRVRLDEDAYRAAAEAHLAGVPVRLRGRLERKGGFRKLTEATGLVPVELDEAERERMLKALRAAGTSGD